MHGPDEDDPLLQQLREMNTPEEIIEEFKRNQSRYLEKDPRDGSGRKGSMTDFTNHPMQITDLNTLMKLEQMVESGSEAILGQAQLNEILKEQRDSEKRPDGVLNCNRCHQLKNQNKLLEYKLREESGPAAPGKITRLADHVASFNRQEIIRSIFKQIYSRSVIFYVIDITNFEGS